MRHLIILCVLLPGLAFGARSADELPAAAFAKLPEIKSAAFSPDGTKLVALRAINETYHVVLFDLVNESSRLLLAADPAEFLYDWCRFANDERIVCRTRSYGQLVAGETGPNYRWYVDGRTTFYRLVAVNTDASESLQLVRPPRATNAREDLEWNSPDQSHVVSWLPNDKSHILIQLARDDRLYPSVYRLNIYDNSMVRVRRHRRPLLTWVGDPEGNLIMAAGLAGRQEPVAVSLLSEWDELDIKSTRGIDPPRFLGVAGDHKSVWVAANNGNDTLGIYRVDLEQGEIAHELYAHPDYDVETLEQHPVTGKPLFATFYSDRLEYVWFDDGVKAVYDAVRAALPGAPSTVKVEAFDHALERFLFYSEGNGTAPCYYYFDNKAKTLARLSESFEALDIIDLKSVVYAAGDGTRIQAWLGLPGPAESGPYPTVVLPHGGPFLRDTGEFDAWAQLFLARGYAVLKPGFRGSSGYGDKFMAAGFNQWGLAMQDDVIAGLDWMITEGYADPDRVCIAGGSYGGYVALVAAFKTPDKFRCAVSFAGVTDLDKLEQRRRTMAFGRLATPRIQSGELRTANSPLAQVDKIGIPILLVHGDLDRNVMLEHATEFAEALEKNGKAYQYIEQAGGDHHLSRQSHRTGFFEAMDEFLSTHLAADN